MLYRRILRPLLFKLSPEAAHALTIRALRLLSRMPWVTRLVRKRCAPDDPRLVTQAFGLTFANPVGLAAGLDKDGEAIEAFAAFGFGCIEVGTLTAEAQPGNPRPRLFRLPRDRALINRMGFNNDGALAAAQRIANMRERHALVGINIGKTKRIALADALDDYAKAASAVASQADYVTINVSSPNTPGLRELQEVDALRPLVLRVREALDSARPRSRVPLLLKIAPDLTDAEIDAIADLALELSLDGIIATNTTIARTNLVSAARDIDACGEGGLSGAPLQARAIAVLRRLHARVGSKVTLIAAGGIENADDAWERIRAGATLLQIYTGLIYEGPLLARRIALGLLERGYDAMGRGEARFSVLPAKAGTHPNQDGFPPARE